jgi:hypothetical protein
LTVIFPYVNEGVIKINGTDFLRVAHMKPSKADKINKAVDAELPRWRHLGDLLYSDAKSGHVAPSPQALAEAFGEAAVKKVSREFDLMDARQKLGQIVTEHPDVPTPQWIGHQLSNLGNPNAYKCNLREIFSMLDDRELRDVQGRLQAVGFEMQGLNIIDFKPRGTP